MPAFIDITGQRFGRLVVKYRDVDHISPKGHHYAKWLCKCNCGKEVAIQGSSLRGQLTRSCGCLNIEVSRKFRWMNPRTIRLPNGEAAFRRVLKNYYQHAKKRNLKFSLTPDQAKRLFLTNCFYCGSIPNSVSKPTWDTGNFIYNGIDRVDNTKGYTLENCVSCCEWCNRMKLNFTQKEFLSHVNKICTHSINREFIK